MDDHRYRDLAIGVHDLMNILQGNVVVKSDLPRGVKIVSVYGCWERNAVVVRLHSPHFDIVPEGEMIPCDAQINLFYTEKIDE
jgi:hypothetical protein